MITIQIVSDLHLETHQSYTDWQLPRTANYLALLGDIGHVQDSGFLTFLEEQLKRFYVVFFLLGNHEPYHMRMPAAKERMRTFAARMEKLRQTTTMGRFVFLDQTRFDVPDTNITVLGCTLFSNVSQEEALDVQTRFVDFRDIVDWDVWYDHNSAHREDLKWLNEQVQKVSDEEPERVVAIFSHYCPTLDRRAHSPYHKRSTVTSGFATDLSNEACWKNPCVKLWGFGHTHFNCDFVDKMTGKRLVANQKGYFKKLPGMKPHPTDEETFHPFNAGKTVELG